MPRIEPIPWEDLDQAQRQMMEEGHKAGAFTDIMPLRILAYADHGEAPDDGDRHPNFPKNLLGGKLLELLRIRSAQLGGCAPCSASRKSDDVTEEMVSCMIASTDMPGLNAREKLALEFLERLANDHHSIGDDLFRRMAEQFTTAEIVELGTTCGGMIGMHRFMHTLDLYNDSEAAIAYDPRQRGATWAELNGEADSPSHVAKAGA